jgi:ABC-type glucose/galactose transport system permease subunit
MFSFEGFLGWLSVVVAGILLSVIQEVAKKYPRMKIVNQRIVSVVLAAVAGGIAALFEFGLGVDLFKDVNNVWDLLRLLTVVFAMGQAYYNFTKK